MFILKVCSEEISQVCQEFVKEGLRATIKPQYTIELDEPQEEAIRIRSLVYEKNLPVFVEFLG